MVAQLQEEAMFDSITNVSGEGGVGSDGYEPEPVKRQYTVKGIDNSTVVLMRNAAQKEGMKIGAWVSLRMREAALRALSETATEKPATVKVNDGVHLAGVSENGAFGRKIHSSNDININLIMSQIESLNAQQKMVMALMDKVLQKID
jgi:hypothetical protein